MRNTNKFLGLIFLAVMLFSCTQEEKELKVLQMNIWQEGTMIEGGFEAIVNEVAFHKPDIVLFSEVRNYNEVDFVSRITDSLRQKGINYYAQSDQSIDVAMLSLYPISAQTVVGRDIHPNAGVLKTTINMEGRTIVAYSAHLDYKNYACYLPRGYSGVTWEKLEAPITYSKEVEDANSLSLRDEAIRGVIADAQKEPEERIVILGGDFNEPSHLDWTEETKNLYDHNGTVVKWQSSVLLAENGFIDSYRSIYPNPVTHPGFTFPSDNKDTEIKRLTWAPTADERDRIDYIYYRPNKNLTLKEAAIFGPVGDIIKSERVPSKSEDCFIEPQDIWPTDHKATISVFSVKMK